MMSKAKYSKFKTEEKNYDYGLIDKRTNEIVASPEKLMEYLEFQSRMDRYTVSNAMLIMSRCPEASQLKEESEWNKLNISVKEGAEKIHVLEPVKYFKDGKAQMNTNVKYVYDISQTNALLIPKKQKGMMKEHLYLHCLQLQKLKRLLQRNCLFLIPVHFMTAKTIPLFSKKKAAAVLNSFRILQENYRFPKLLTTAMNTTAANANLLLNVQHICFVENTVLTHRDLISIPFLTNGQMMKRKMSA